MFIAINKYGKNLFIQINSCDANGLTQRGRFVLRHFQLRTTSSASDMRS